MLKKIIFSLTLVFGLMGISEAQVTTNGTILEQTARGYKIRDYDNYNKALVMAKKKGWPLTFTGRNNASAVLVGMDLFGLPLYYTTQNNTIAAATTRASQLWPGGASGLNLSGSSAYLKNKLGIWDGGRPLDTHVELTGRITWKETGTFAYDDHPTHTTGTMIAKGVNPSAKGMVYDFPGIIAYNFQGDLTTIAGEAAGLLLSNHSYSNIAGWYYNSSQNRWEFYGRYNDKEDYKFGYYNDQAQALDSITYNAPFYLIVKSAGNKRDENGPAVGSPYFRYDSTGAMASAGNRPDGISNNDSYDIISTDCNAKNILTVGAVGGLPGGYNQASDVALTSFSSWGPTDDGRIKPDLVADGVNVLSSTAASTTSYAAYSGTSMSSPNAAGSLMLLQEYYSKLKNSSTAFMRAATLKGLAIHTTDAASTTPGPNYQSGWGLLNVEKGAAVMTAAIPSGNAGTSAHLLYENTLNNGDSLVIPVIASGKGPLKATICWTDIKGDVDRVNVLNNRTKKLVNDLDLRIRATSKIYMPWTLNPAIPSAAAVPGDNITDNMERIDVDSTIPGQTYTIVVKHKGTLARGSQAYSLLVSGVGGSAYCASAPASNAGSRIDSVSFQTIHLANPPGYTTYTDNTKLVADIEPSQTVALAVKVGSADGTNAQKIVKVFIDYNNNGSFADSGELVATSVVPLNNGDIFKANIVTPAKLVVGNLSLMRIVLQETANATDVSSCSNPGYQKGETQDYRIRVVSASNDIGLSEVVSPRAGDCANTEQYLTVKLTNYGKADQSNIPVTVDVKNNGITVVTLNGTYKGVVKAGSAVNFTIQTPFVTTAGTNYAITATASLAGDQNPANNTLTTTVSISPKPGGPSGAGEICGANTAYLKVNNPNPSANYFWYVSPTDNKPLANGRSITATTIPANNTFYLGTEINSTIGPADKMQFPQGGYNNFIGNYVTFTNKVPLLIESARLYIGNPGTIKMTVGTIVSMNATDGSFTYTPLSTTTLNVVPTNPTPAPGAVIGNPANDSGAVYLLNLPVIPTGDHILLVQCDQGGATIFRNNNIAGTSTYPISIPGVMSITGNSAKDSTDPNFYQKYYYFFYNTKINTGDCVSDRTPVVVTDAPAPVISQVADSLVCNITTGVQWYLNDAAIPGATTQKYKPVNSGTYKAAATDAFGCQKTSNTIQVAITALPPEVLAREIKLSVSPNPNNGVFNLSFETTAKGDLGIDIFNASGQRVYTQSYPGFSGKFAKQITLNSTSEAVYVLKIQHDKKTYTQKIIIQR